MAVFGRIARIGARLYRDMNTGRFIPFSQAKPLIEASRAYAALRGDLRGAFERSATTLIDRLRINRNDAEEIIRSNIRDYADWKKGGELEKRPEWVSP